MKIENSVRCAVFYGLALAVSALAAEPLAPTPVKSWKVGDSWTLCVEQYSREWMNGFGQSSNPKGCVQPKVVARYLTRVKLAEVQKLGDVRCFVVDYVPGQNASAGAQKPCRLFVRERDGWTQKVLQDTADVSALWLEQMGEASVLNATPEGCPIEMWPLDRVLSIKPSRGFLSLELRQVKTGNNQLFAECILSSGNREELRVQQTWDQGAKWWTEYVRYVKGHKDLHARLVPDNTPSQPSAMPPPLRPPFRLEGLSVNVHDDPFRLHTDPRLQAKVSFNLKVPTVEDVLQKLRQATVVELTCDDSAQSRAPVADSLSMHEFPAWQAMVNLARSKTIQGKWEHYGNGYRLSSPLPKPVVATPSPSKPPTPNATARLLWTYFLSFAPLLILLAIVHFRRWRQKQQADAASQRRTDATSPPPLENR